MIHVSQFAGNPLFGQLNMRCSAAAQVSFAVKGDKLYPRISEQSPLHLFGREQIRMNKL